jgi:hypothetical protein
VVYLRELCTKSDLRIVAPASPPDVRRGFAPPLEFGHLKQVSHYIY